jgi:hypothetical protein
VRVRDRQTDRETDRQTDRQRGRERERETERQRESVNARYACVCRRETGRERERGREGECVCVGGGCARMQEERKTVSSKMVTVASLGSNEK